MGLSWFIDGDDRPSLPTGYEAPTALKLAPEVFYFVRVPSTSVMIAEASPQAYDIISLTTAHHATIWDASPNTETKKLTAEEIGAFWYQPFLPLIEANDDFIDATAYINVNWDTQKMWGTPYQSGYWEDTRLEKNDEIAQRWNAAINH